MSDQSSSLEKTIRTVKASRRSKDVLPEHRDELGTIESSLQHVDDPSDRFGSTWNISLNTMGHVDDPSDRFSIPAAIQNFSRMHTPRTREMPIAARVSALEKRVNRQELAIKELESRMNSGSSQDRLDEIIAHMISVFRELEHVIEVRYVVLWDGTWHVVVIHTLDDRSKALETICKKSLEIHNAFPDVTLTPLVLHKNEVRRGHVAGTKSVFLKAWK